ncbi:PREDICTED: probable flavin-containing monooxygenase 1 [Ipomoea nil]|uniref:probable flavin-containing monooxygenase 1 n=1 Tax=Ipomoea nil TaxID=35883 RepID=UPI0009014FED|nr:PREDICTED: probable flavin-containing monooxygenase 1 [Ipomoea nil]
MSKTGVRSHMMRGFTKMEEKRIGIVGAGISGLLACKHAMEKGFTPTIFEAKNGVGGVWSETIASTRLQTPKDHYTFSDFPWPDSVTDTFPDHDQVLDYIVSYAVRYNILPQIRFNSKVVSIHYHHGNEEKDVLCRKAAFSSKGKWSVVVQNVRHPEKPNEVYEFDFVVLCIGKFSDVPRIPQFPMNKGPEVFDGKVIHSMDYAAMGNFHAAQFIKNKRVTVVGFQKSAVDIATEIARLNGTRFPCTLLHRTVHWTVPESLVKLLFTNLNRFSEFLIHKPQESFFIWLLAVLASPLLWVFSKAVESYLKWIYPLKKHNMVPDHGFLEQISSCKFTVLPADFYSKVAEGSIVLKRSRTFSFCKTGLILQDDDDDDDASPLETDVVIFATGYESDEKLCSIFASNHFKNRITGSSTPLYRGCIDPHIPQLAILGYSESPSILHTTEMQSKWLAHFLAGQFGLPKVSEMEDDARRWEKCLQKYAGRHYKRACASVLLQIYCNDQLCKDMNCNPRRKNGFFSEMFCPYSPVDYRT